MTEKVDIDPTAPDPLDKAVSGLQILETKYPPVQFVVPGLIPEGLTLLVAAPKIGKSWFVLALSLACSQGGYVLGKIQVDKRPVLYMALEDGERRLQDRMKKLGATTGEDLANLTFLTETAPTTAGTIIHTYLQRKGSEKPLIVLDTLGRARGAYSGNDAYGKDYTDMARLKSYVDMYPGSSLVIVHHTNKGGGQSDFLGAVSGTQGLAGAADSILLIERPRGGKSSILKVTSRDTGEGEYAVTLNESGQWELVGDDLKAAAAAAITTEQSAGLGDLSTKILEVVNRYPEPQSIENISQLAGVDKETAGRYLRRLAEDGRIERPGRGKFAPLRNVMPLPMSA